MMTKPLEDRLQRIERRISALEAPGPACRPVPTAARSRPPAEPPPPPGSRTAPPRTRAPRRAPVDLERLFGVAVLGRVGVAAVVLAAGYFAQLAYYELSDLAKVVSIYALAGTFFGVGKALRSRVASRYVSLLWGGGVALAYLAGAVAYLQYQLVGPPVALVMLFGASALGQALALRQRQALLLTTALGGAFAAPLLIGHLGSPWGGFLPVYALSLHAWSAWAEVRWGWRSARLAGIAGTIAVAASWYFDHGLVDARTFATLNVYLIGLVLPELQGIVVGRACSFYRTAAVVVGVAVVELWLWLTSVVGLDTVAVPAFGWIAGAVWMVTGAVLLPGAERSRYGGPARGLAAVGGLLLALGCLAAPEVIGATAPSARHTWVIGSLVACGLGMVGMRRIVGVGEFGAAAATVIAALALRFGPDVQTTFWLTPVAATPALALLVSGRSAAARATAVLAGLLALWGGCVEGRALDANWLAVALGAGTLWLAFALGRGVPRRDRAVVVAATAGLLLLAFDWWVTAFDGVLATVRVPVVDPVTCAGLALAAVAGWFGTRVRDVHAGLLMALWSVALGVSFAAGLREVQAATAGATGAWQDVMVSVYMTAYSSVMLLIGFVARSARPRYVALAGFAIVAIKVGVHDLAAASLPLRVLVTGVLGLALLATAYAYSRVQRVPAAAP